jgi:uncharacterized protein YjbJ (UPF0337 family)
MTLLDDSRQVTFPSDSQTKQVERRDEKMNRDVLEGQWKQLKGKVKQQWGRLTDDELDQVNGRYDELAGLIQERYGYSRDEAANELDMFLRNLDTHTDRDM